MLQNIYSDFNKTRKGENKKVKELEDLKRAIQALREAGEMPLVLGTSMQLSRCSQSWGVPESPTCQYIIGKIAFLEKSVADSIEAQKEQFKQVNEQLANLKAVHVPAPKTSAAPLATFSTDTPNTQKRKVLEEKDSQTGCL